MTHLQPLAWLILAGLVFPPLFGPLLAPFYPQYPTLLALWGGTASDPTGTALASAVAVRHFIGALGLGHILRAACVQTPWAPVNSLIGAALIGLAMVGLAGGPFTTLFEASGLPLPGLRGANLAAPLGAGEAAVLGWPLVPGQAPAGPHPNALWSLLPNWLW